MTLYDKILGWARDVPWHSGDDEEDPEFLEGRDGSYTRTDPKSGERYWYSLTGERLHKYVKED